MLLYACFPFLCWVKFCSGYFRQVYFHLGDKKVVAGHVRQVVILYSNDCMGIFLGGLSVGHLRRVVIWTGLTVVWTTNTEIEAIGNSRPLVVESINDINSEVTVSPINLLIMKSKVIMSPPGEFSWPDIYCRKWCRRVQHLSNNYGVDGIKNSCYHCKKGKNGHPQEETSSQKTSSF